MPRVAGVVVAGCVVAMAAGVAGATEDHMHQAPAVSTELERVKQWAGRWEGTSRDGDKDMQPAVVEYRKLEAALNSAA